MTKKRAKSADQTPLGTTETAGAPRSPPRKSGEPGRLRSSAPLQSSSGEGRKKPAKARLEVEYSARTARNFCMFLVGVELSLVLLYLISKLFLVGLPVGWLRKLLNLNSEVSIATWFSTVQLFALGVLLLLIAGRIRRKQHYLTIFVAIAGIAFIYLSADEAAMLHEKVTSIARQYDIGFILIKGKTNAWVAVYLFLGLVFFVFAFSRFLKPMFRDYQRETYILIFGLAIYLVGVVGVEVVQRFRSSYLLVALEEFLEMSGITLILFGSLLLGLKMLSPDPQTKQSSDSPAPRSGASF